MQNDVQIADTSELSYLEASKVSSPAGVLSELDVVNAQGQRLGNIEGVVIDAAARCVRYLCVRSSGWFGPAIPRPRRSVGSDRRRTQGASPPGRSRQEAVHGLDAAALRRFSDDDCSRLCSRDDAMRTSAIFCLAQAFGGGPACACGASPVSWRFADAMRWHRCWPC